MPIDVAIAEQLHRFASLLYFLEAIAVIVCAFSGMLAARAKDLDFVGTYVVAFITAFGGGTLRDLLLDRRPFFWVSYPEYTAVIFLICLAFVYFPRQFRTAPSGLRHLFSIFDAIGLALFSLSGVTYAIAYQMPYFIIPILGTITGVFGGVLRDIVLAELPLVFRTESCLYATCAFSGGWLYLLCLQLNIQRPTAALIGCFAIVALRLLSIRYHLRLPTPIYSQRRQSRTRNDSQHLSPPSVQTQLLNAPENK